MSKSKFASPEQQAAVMAQNFHGGKIKAYSVGARKEVEVDKENAQVVIMKNGRLAIKLMPPGMSEFYKFVKDPSKK